MRVILDTHLLLWMFGRSARLSNMARSILADTENDLIFSIAGYWEIGIKMSIGKLELAPGWEESIPHEMVRNGISWLAVSPAHIHRVSTLPWHHRDPFDRLLVAQAMEEGASILTSDSFFDAYDVPVIW